MPKEINAKAEIEALMEKLTPLQKKHYPSILWLLNDGAHRSGKSYLLAMVYIVIAIETHKKVYVRDHFPTKEADKALFRLIRIICSMLKHHQFKFGQGWLTFIGYTDCRAVGRAERIV